MKVDKSFPIYKKNNISHNFMSSDWIESNVGFLFILQSYYSSYRKIRKYGTDIVNNTTQEGLNFS